MTPNNHIKLTSSLLVVSITLEITLLAELFSISDAFYHSLHVLFIAIVVMSQLSLYITNKSDKGFHQFALLFAVGMAFTGVGDYVNGAISHVQPVSLKLTWAMVLFGAGYTLYCIALWQHAQMVKAKNGAIAKRYLIAIPFAIVNVVSWFTHVEHNVQAMDLLYYGSFVFNLTIYVALPMFAAWYFFDSKWSIGGLLVFLGALLIPYSDLILFGSWLRNGDPAVPSFPLYAYNWILYFSGQVLTSMFPAIVLDADDRKR